MALIWTTLLLLAVQSARDVAGCNEAVCASLVSKCLLLKSCDCDMSDRHNCSCCTDCQRCLALLYSDCCSCVGMCPARTTDDDDGLSRSSTVEELPDAIPELFDVLTSQLDPLSRWTTYTYPAYLDLLYFHPPNTTLSPIHTRVNQDDDVRLELRRHGGQVIAMEWATTTTNCTVAYMSSCQSVARCRQSCQSMGAARYRWFHADACCQCVGSTCIDFGKPEARCLHCPQQPARHVDTEEADDDDGMQQDVEHETADELT